MILGIVTARLGSTRLHAKALLPMGESTMVGRVFDVMSKSKVDKAVLCTPDAFLGNFIDGEVKVWGGERDVLSELFYAAYKYNADHIVRITADCPFLTPEIIDKVIEKHLESGADYTYNHHDLFPTDTKEGIDVEVVTFNTLKELHCSSADREHLCTNIEYLDSCRIDMEEERDVFSVNTLEEYMKAYKEI